MPEHANNMGHVFGGVILSMMDKTAAICAFRHSRASVVTASIDRVESIGSLEVGNQLDAVVIGGVLSDLIRVGGPVISHVIKRGRIEFKR